jgi:hypothetical protein
MPLDLQVIRASEFVKVASTGSFDLDASKATLATIAHACRKRGVRNAILDLRAFQPGPKPVFSPGDLIELVNTFHDVGFTQDLRLAVLYKADPFKRARLFAFVSTLHHYQVQAFHDFEEALLWLSQREGTGADIPRVGAGHTVPIPVRRQGARAEIKIVPRSSAEPGRAEPSARPDGPSGRRHAVTTARVAHLRSAHSTHSSSGSRRAQMD